MLTLLRIVNTTALLALASGCATMVSSPSGMSSPSVTKLEDDWGLATLDGSPAQAGLLTIRFGAASAAGAIGCNRFEAPVRVENGALRLGKPG